MKKQTVKTTIVGGQPPGNERPLQKIPVGIEQLLAMAAVDDKFAAALLANREEAIKASGVELTPTEKQIILPIDDKSLEQMIENVKGRIPAKERRAFIKKSAAALLALVGAGFLSLAQGCEGPAVTGAVPDRPQPKPAPAGERPDRPRTQGIQPDRPKSANEKPAEEKEQGEVEEEPEPKRQFRTTGISPDRPEKKGK